MLSYPISTLLLRLPVWTHYLLFFIAFAITFFTLRFRRVSLVFFGALTAFGLAYGIGNIFFHMNGSTLPSLEVITLPPNTSSLWIVCGCAALIVGIISYFWKGFGIFVSNLFFGFSIGFLTTNRLIVSLLLGLFMAFFQSLSPHLTWLLASSLSGSLWGGAAMGLILHNARFHIVLLWSAGFFVAGSLFQWAINRDLFKKKSLIPEENASHEMETDFSLADSTLPLAPAEQDSLSFKNEENPLENSSPEVNPSISQVLPSTNEIPRDNPAAMEENFSISSSSSLSSSSTPSSTDFIDQGEKNSNTP